MSALAKKSRVPEVITLHPKRNVPGFSQPVNHKFKEGTKDDEVNEENHKMALKATLVPDNSHSMFNILRKLSEQYEDGLISIHEYRDKILLHLCDLDMDEEEDARDDMTALASALLDADPI